MAETCACGEAVRRLARSLHWLVIHSEGKRPTDTLSASGASWSGSWDVQRDCGVSMDRLRDHLREVMPAVGRGDWDTAVRKAKEAKEEPKKIIEPCPSKPCKCAVATDEAAKKIYAARDAAFRGDKAKYLSEADKALEAITNVERECGIIVDPARRSLYSGMDFADKELYEAANRAARDAYTALGRSFRACMRIIELMMRYVGRV